MTKRTGGSVAADRQLQENSTGAAANPMVTGVIWQQLLIFFVPLLAGTFFQLLYNTVDAIIVGRFVGKLALSAVGGATATLINLFVGLFVGITSGVTVVVSQFYGAKREKELKKAVHTGIALAMVLGVVLTVAVFALAGVMLRGMDTPAETMQQSETYLRIYACGMIGNMLYNTGASILRAIGDSRRPFYYLVAGTLTNIVLDVVMVVFFKWGVAGAALATIISQYVSAFCAFAYLLRTDDMVHVDLREIRLEPLYAEKILRIGIPSALRSLMKKTAWISSGAKDASASAYAAGYSARMSSHLSAPGRTCCGYGCRKKRS